MIANISSWTASRTTAKDRLIAEVLLRVNRLLRFELDMHAELISKVRYLVGFQIPTECISIIKSYLLLPPDVFHLRMNTPCNFCSITHIWTDLTVNRGGQFGDDANDANQLFCISCVYYIENGEDEDQDEPYDHYYPVGGGYYY